jgi:hypothetical protein
MLEFRGPHAEFLADATPEIDFEGSRNSGKTICCLWKELEALRRAPGMWALLARFSDDATKTLLRPELERVARIHGTDLGRWNASENSYDLPTGSRVYCFGLKTVSSDADTRYKKIRGLSVSRIYVDQAEELPADIASELRFPLRPDITARALGRSYPTQLTFSPNPPDVDHWLAKQFPTHNTIPGRRYYGLSIYDNAHNLSAEQLAALEVEFPPEHPRHQTLILGQRGPNVTGEAVFEGVYDRRIHRRALTVRSETPVLEAWYWGQHNPCWIAGQRGYFGGLRLLAGIQGQHLMMTDFVPLVLRYRTEWFPGARVESCAPPMGAHHHQPGRTAPPLTSRAGLIHAALQAHGITPIWRPDADAPDVKLALIEELADYLRRRVGPEEAFGLHDDPARWLTATLEGVSQRPFVSYALDGGYVWDDQVISVSHEAIRRPADDDDYHNALQCVLYVLLHFCRRPSEQTIADRRTEARRRELEAANPFASASPHAWLGY